ncbi:hypothetical protein Trydic_g6866 [Trypoxylus dichotomus]
MVRASISAKIPVMFRNTFDFSGRSLWEVFSQLRYDMHQLRRSCASEGEMWAITSLDGDDHYVGLVNRHDASHRRCRDVDDTDSLFDYHNNSLGKR